MFNIVRRRSSLDCRSSTRQAAGGHLSTRQAVSGRGPHVANLIFNIERLIDSAGGPGRGPHVADLIFNIDRGGHPSTANLRT